MTDTGLRTMMRVVTGLAGGLYSTEPSDEAEPLPRYFPASTVVLATALCVLAVAAFGGLRTLVAELTGYSAVLGGLWALSAVVLFAPTAVAFLVRPARRVAALAAGLAAGAVLGTTVGLWVADAVPGPWPIMAGLALGALALAAAFGLTSREPAVATG